MTEEQVEKIIRNWSTDQDTWQGEKYWGKPDETFESCLQYPPAAEFWGIDSKKTRALPEYWQVEARRFIEAYCKRYPLQVRVMLGLPMWLRFCHSWQRTGDPRKAMRAI